MIFLYYQYTIKVLNLLLTRHFKKSSNRLFINILYKSAINFNLTVNR